MEILDLKTKLGHSSSKIIELEQNCEFESRCEELEQHIRFLEEENIRLISHKKSEVSNRGGQEAYINSLKEEIERLAVLIFLKFAQEMNTELMKDVESYQSNSGVHHQKETEKLHRHIESLTKEINTLRNFNQS